MTSNMIARSLRAALFAALCSASAFAQTAVLDSITAITGFTGGAITDSGLVYGHDASGVAATWSNGTTTEVSGASASSFARGAYGSTVYGTVGSSAYQAVSYSGGVTTNYSVAMGSPYSANVEGVSSSGVAYGYYNTTNGATAIAFTIGGSGSVKLLNGTNGAANVGNLYASNSSGIAVGWAPGSTIGNAITYNLSTGAVTTHAELGTSTYSVAYGINDSGTFVGTVVVGGVTESFVDTGSAATEFTASWGTGNTYAESISNSGIIVGDATISGGLDHAFVDINGTVTDLNTLAGVSGMVGSGNYLKYADHISDSGIILASDQNGHYYEISVSAVPEPRTWALIIGSVALVGAIVVRRRRAAAVQVAV